MRKLAALASLAVVSLPLLASAQPPPPPPPPGGGGGMSGEPEEPKMGLAAGIIIGLPQQDLSEADTSPGINLQFAYTVAPHIAIVAGLRYFAVQFSGNTGGFDLSNYDFDVGGRYSVPVSPTMKAFGEAMLIYSTVSISGGGSSSSESGVGFGARGGAMFGVSGNISLGAAVSYTTASINDGDAGWLGLEAFANFGF